MYAWHDRIVISRAFLRLSRYTYRQFAVNAGPVMPARFGERVACAPASGSVLRQDGPLDQVDDIAVCSVLRTLGKLRPIRQVSLPSNPSSKSVDDLPLPVIERLPGVHFPEAGFPQHARQFGLRARRRPRKSAARTNHCSAVVKDCDILIVHSRMS